MIKTSELKNAKYVFIQVTKAYFGFINSRSMVEFWYNLGNFEGYCLNYSLFIIVNKNNFIVFTNCKLS